MTPPPPYLRRRRAAPPETHPIDVIARRIRDESTDPRQDFANEVDDLIVAWAARGYVEPTITLHDWIKTLAFAADERERALGLRRGAVAEPWRPDA